MALAPGIDGALTRRDAMLPDDCRPQMSAGNPFASRNKKCLFVLVIGRQAYLLGDNAIFFLDGQVGSSSLAAIRAVQTLHF